MKPTRSLVLLTAIGILGATILVSVQIHRAIHPLAGTGPIDRRTLAETYDLHDLGVTDIDGDGLLDIYSLNHSNRQIMLVRAPDGGYVDQLVELGLSQSSEFPGVEGGAEVPDTSVAGMYVYWRDGRFFLQTTAPFSASGIITFPRRLQLDVEGGASMTPDGEQKYRFHLPPGSRIRVSSWSFYFPPDLELDEDVALENVYVGPRRASPGSRHISLPEQDRHGMAWADYDGDGDADVVIVRGGDHGRLAETHPGALDELFVAEGSRYKNTTGSAGFIKYGMPAREVQWVDVNGDGLLDIFVVNGRTEPPNENAPNHVYFQDTKGRFHEAAASIGLDTPGQGRSLWLDMELDSDMDLLWADAKSIQVFLNHEGTFTPATITNISGAPNQLTAADFDADGDIDVFVAGKTGNLLLINHGATFEPKDPGEFGLPARSFTANWVDHDNDGRIDLHVLPQGMYRQIAGGRFEPTGAFAMKTSKLLSDRRVLCTWFDADNNGTRDLLVSIPDPVSSARAWLEQRLQEHVLFRPRKWHVYLYPVPVAERHNWLQVSLTGPKGNRPAIGARIELTTPTSRHTREVGHAEGALHSQGHHRIYFGLGDESNVSQMTVTWPDGTKKIVPSPSPNQLLEIRYDE